MRIRLLITMLIILSSFSLAQNKAHPRDVKYNADDALDISFDPINENILTHPTSFNCKPLRHTTTVNFDSVASPFRTTRITVEMWSTDATHYADVSFDGGVTFFRLKALAGTYRNMTFYQGTYYIKIRGSHAGDTVQVLFE